MEATVSHSQTFIRDSAGLAICENIWKAWVQGYNGRPESKATACQLFSLLLPANVIR